MESFCGTPKVVRIVLFAQFDCLGGFTEHDSEIRLRQKRIPGEPRFRFL